MREPLSLWIGKDEHNGVLSETIPDRDPPSRWRLEDVVAVQRPRHLDVATDGRVLFVLDTDTSDLYSLTAAGGTPVRLTVDRELVAYWEDGQPRWSGDGTQVAYTDEDGVRVVPAEGGPARILVDAHSPVWLDERRLLVAVERDRRTRLASIDLEDSWPRPLTAGEADFAQLVVSPSGTLLAYVVFPTDDRYRSDIAVLDLSSEKEVRLTNVPAIQNHSPVFHPDGTSLAFSSERSGRHELYLLGIDGTGERQLTNDGADFFDASFSADGSLLLATRTDAGRTDLVIVDVPTGAVKVLAKGGLWAFPRWLLSGEIVATFEDHRTAPRIEVVDRDGGRRILFDSTPATIRTAPHTEPEHLFYPSFDGTAIPGWLYRPAVAVNGQVPAVVYAHGGPTDHYGDDWDGYAQYFLEMGYAWFGINVRGSSSYGLEFERSNHGGWGIKDTEDCLAAADYLAGLGWVDGRRIAIFGPSYGAYLTICSLAFDPQHRFACGAAKYGDCDILTTWAHGDRAGREAMERTMPRPNLIPDSYRAGSPIHKVEDIDAPLLICHGEQDTNVNPKQSEELVERLRFHDKTFEYITYPTEGHGLLRRGPQLHFYRRLERFLGWYLLAGRP